MESCPIEILQHIFEIACTDGGKTAWSLSLVSQRVHSNSRRSRFHTVALRNARQLKTFSNLLGDSAHPEGIMNVRDLFIAVSAEDDSEPTIHSTSRKRATVFSKEIRSAVSKTLAALAPSLLTLSLYLYFPYDDAWVILPLPFAFPSLSNLALSHRSARDTLLQQTLFQLPECPKLERLVLMGFVRTNSPSADVMEAIRRFAPNLTHLCIPASAVELVISMSMPTSLHPDIVRYANDLSYLIVHPSPQSNLVDIFNTRRLQFLIEQRLAYVTRNWSYGPTPQSRFKMREAWLRAWIEGMDGGHGYWSQAVQDKGYGI